MAWPLAVLVSDLLRFFRVFRHSRRAVLSFRNPPRHEFRQPYLARSPQEFWRRWHITLSEWIRDYLYIPLGGNKGGFLKSAVVLICVMMLAGLWHGANWTFVVWGLDGLWSS
jgi:D-alanyl-lipoteichoic acid acyltransferase DltB (MBOAT superfamily)